ncbi:ribosomal-alanine N-acetyltransferase [Micractinium conductrix]|uniref:Ribosomal-alanine N-acetyltransferase n=1 Tax=Micractinium conductrix TaxID=554055 RepID=A0A2P6V705_9CHLO|nr:ribosomal-alanine N-acetyltransferase [Micractinium conductrix]|eukprot:PSC69874.1 ribosomal-alanine N-acetyltransferase [Micractinium conductrix]
MYSLLRRTQGSAWPDGVPRGSGATPVAATAACSTAAAAAAAEGPSAYVSNVVVAPAQRGRGLGRALLAAGLAAAGERWPVACVYCHVETDNEAALALYRGAGFTQLGDELPAEPDGLAKRLLLYRQLPCGA